MSLVSLEKRRSLILKASESERLDVCPRHDDQLRLSRQQALVLGASGSPILLERYPTPDVSIHSGEWCTYQLGLDIRFLSVVFSSVYLIRYRCYCQSLPLPLSYSLFQDKK